MKVAFVGAPTSGKSTLSMGITAMMKEQGLNADLVTEYPRSYIEKYGHPSSLLEQLLIADEWLDMVDRSSIYDFTICDNAPFTSFFFAVNLMDISSQKDKEIVSRLYAKLLNDLTSYDFVYYLPLRDYNCDDGLRLCNSRKFYEYIDNSISLCLEAYRIPCGEIKEINKEEIVKDILEIKAIKESK